MFALSLAQISPDSGSQMENIILKSIWHIFSVGFGFGLLLCHFNTSESRKSQKYFSNPQLEIVDITNQAPD